MSWEDVMNADMASAKIWARRESGTAKPQSKITLMPSLDLVYAIKMERALRKI